MSSILDEFQDERNFRAFTSRRVSERILGVTPDIYQPLSGTSVGDLQSQESYPAMATGRGPKGDVQHDGLEVISYPLWEQLVAANASLSLMTFSKDRCIPIHDSCEMRLPFRTRARKNLR